MDIWDGSLPEFEANSGNLRCPTCGEIEIYGGYGVDVSPASPDDSQGGGTRIAFRCAAGHDSAIVIGNHKGTLLIRLYSATKDKSESLPRGSRPG